MLAILTSVKRYLIVVLKGFPGGTVVKNPSANAWDTGLIPGLGSSPGEGKGNVLRHACLGNPVDRGAWWATVHGVAESDMTEQLNSSSSSINYPYLARQEKWQAVRKDNVFRLSEDVWNPSSAPKQACSTHLPSPWGCVNNVRSHRRLEMLHPQQKNLFPQIALLFWEFPSPP